MEVDPGAVVRQLAAGEAHTLALTANGSVYSWGRGMFGRLGTGNEYDEPSPVLISFMPDAPKMKAVSGEEIDNFKGPTVPMVLGETEPKIVGIAAGAYHSLALTDDGTVWSWGYDLGRDGPTSKPGQVTVLKESVAFSEISEHLQDGRSFEAEKGIVKAVAVGAGGMMSCVIDDHGALWFWEAGKKVCWSVFEHPEIVRDVNMKAEVLKVACGSGNHVLALVRPVEGTAGVAVYSWGDNKHGQLGLGHEVSMPTPQLLSGKVAVEVNATALIACGAFHSVVVPSACTTIGNSALYESGGSVCWTFGLGENGQLGHGTSASSSHPKPVQGLPKAEPIVAVDCGLFHTSVELSSGSVWAWGMEGGCGLCPGIGASGGDALTPILMLRKLSSQLSSTSSTLVCGAAHTIAGDCNGLVLWAWGRGQHGALGRGVLEDCWAPCQVKWPPSQMKSGTCNQSSQTKVEVADPLKLHPSLQSVGDGEMSGRFPDNALYSQSLEEIQRLKAELTSAQSRANLLHFLVYGRSMTDAAYGPVRIDGGRDVFSQGPAAISQSLVSDWEKEMEEASDDILAHLENFYRGMRGKVKDEMLRRKTEAWCRMYSASSTGHISSGTQNGRGTSEARILANQGDYQMSYSAKELEGLSQKLRLL